jgi:hypothetical protein
MNIFAQDHLHLCCESQGRCEARVAVVVAYTALVQSASPRGHGFEPHSCHCQIAAAQRQTWRAPVRQQRHSTNAEVGPRARARQRVPSPCSKHTFLLRRLAEFGCSSSELSNERSVVSIHGPLGYERNTVNTAPLRCVYKDPSFAEHAQGHCVAIVGALLPHFDGQEWFGR